MVDIKRKIKQWGFNIESHCVDSETCVMCRSARHPESGETAQNEENVNLI